jgi:hydroxymethylbilane synthase
MPQRPLATQGTVAENGRLYRAPHWFPTLNRMPNLRHLRIGTRTSPLAMRQAEWVAHQIVVCGGQAELVPISTEGDRVKEDAIGSFGSPGVFTKELQRALLEGRIDVAVHSLKDLPTDVVAGLTLAAVPLREDVSDVLVSREQLPLDGLRPQARVGTGSLRRRAQLRHVRPDLIVEDIRGNVDTRLRKLAEGQFDAIVLAAAGLRRLGRAAEITQFLPADIMLSAIGQGALGIETRADDDEAHAVLAALDDPTTHAAVIAERAMLARLRGGCLAPVGGWCRAGSEGDLVLTGAVLSVDGHTKLVREKTGTPSDAEQLGQGVADLLLADGAAALIDQSRRTD